MKWVRGEEIGHGGFASVSKATVTTQTDDVNNNNNIPPTVALKSCNSFFSGPLKKEKEILDTIGICPQIIRCFGDEISLEDGSEIYNLLLEFAPGGTLADLARTHGGRLPETLLRRHARTILEGLETIHSRGFVHCDIKPQNVLVFGPGEVKIADFGAAVERVRGGKETKHDMRGTPQYIAPESVTLSEYEPPSDVWALGCLVAELASGRAVWDYPDDSNVWAMLMRIAGDTEEAEIPAELSEEGRDFVSKCLVKDPKKRWTVPMLLNHAFVDINNISDESELLPAKNKWKSYFTALLNGAAAVGRNLMTEHNSDVDSWDSNVGFFIYYYFP